MHLRRVIICAVQAAAEGPGGTKEVAEGWRKGGLRRGRRMEKEITRRWTTRFAWKLVSVLAKSYYALSFFPSAPPLSLSLLWLSLLFRSRLLSLSFVSPRSLCTLSLSHTQRRVDACVRTQARKVLLSPILIHVQRRISNLVSLFLSHSRFRCPLSLSLLTRFSPPL